MNSTLPWDRILKGTGWSFGVVEVLLLMAAALILIPSHILPLGSGSYVLLGLYLANWLAVLALVGLVLTAAWILIKATTIGLNQFRNSSYSQNNWWRAHGRC